MPEPTQPATWREIEAALDRIARSYGFSPFLDRNDSGEIMIQFQHETFSLAELAKDLAEELDA